MDMMFAVQPDIQTVGLLYSNSEANSTTPIAEAKAYLDAKGIAYVEKTGNTNDEIMTAASSMVGQVDAVFTPTDNVVMAAAAAVSETLTKGGIPFYTGADSFVTAGAFATCGVNYTELGTYTADMALDILETGVVGERAWPSPEIFRAVARFSPPVLRTSPSQRGTSLIREEVTLCLPLPPC